MSVQSGKGALGHLLVDGPSLCSVRDNCHCHCATVGVCIYSTKHRLGECDSGFLGVWNMNTHRPQLTVVPELCLLAQVVNSLECPKLSVFQALTVQLFSALLNVEIHLIDLPLLERNHDGHGTKHVLGVSRPEMSKEFSNDCVNSLEFEGIPTLKSTVK